MIIIMIIIIIMILCSYIPLCVIYIDLSDTLVEAFHAAYVCSPKCKTWRALQQACPHCIVTLCKMWAEGQLSDLWHMAEAHTSNSHSKRSSLPKGDTVKKRVGSAISLAQDGLFGKACQVLVSPGVAPPNNYKTWRVLVDKHPERACPSVPTFDSSRYCYPT